MKERPILFSGEMVRAILAGRKTQTRRVILPQLPLPAQSPFEGKDGAWRWTMTGKVSNIHEERECPYGMPGDQLWVREMWAPHDDSTMQTRDLDEIYYRADDETKYETDMGWKPSIHMPRWVSRITLAVTKVRVERVQGISEADCYAEGIQIPVEKVCDKPKPFLRISGEYPPSRYLPENASTAQWLQAHYASLWDSINAARGFGWDQNPWVWVVEFKALEVRA
jgi:hypothetical protein